MKDAKVTGGAWRPALAARIRRRSTPSVVFDAVALVLSRDAGAYLAQEAAAVDWVRDAFGHLKAIACDDGARAVLDAAGIEPDAGVVDAGDTARFIKAAMTRQWAREPKVRTLP